MISLIILLSLVSYTSAQYPDFPANMTRSGFTDSASEINEVIEDMKLEFDADLIFARVNITKFDSGFYDCCIRIPNLICSNGNILAEGWTSNVTLRCISFLTVEYMLVFYQFNITLPPVELPSDPPVLPPTEPTFEDYPMSNRIIIILLAIIVALAIIFIVAYAILLVFERIKRMNKPKKNSINL